MELSFAAATDVGRQRNHNEDNFLIDKKLRLFMVCDGMGGHAAGEVASSIAVHEIRDALNTHREVIDRYRVDHPGVQPYEILQVLEGAVQAACNAVHTRAPAEPDKRGKGTTATLALIARSGRPPPPVLPPRRRSPGGPARQPQPPIHAGPHPATNRPGPPWAVDAE